MEWVDYGVSVLDPGLVAEIPGGSPVDLADVFHELSGAGRLAGYEVHERFYEIGSPDGLAEVEGILRRARAVPSRAPGVGVAELTTEPAAGELARRHGRSGPTIPEVTLLVPADDVAAPELSIVIPALNEEITIERFIDWCHEGIARGRHRRRDPDHRQRRRPHAPSSRSRRARGC